MLSISSAYRACWLSNLIWFLFRHEMSDMGIKWVDLKKNNTSFSSNGENSLLCLSKMHRLE